MPRPNVLITWGSFYTQDWLEENWPRLLEGCDLRFTDLNDGPEWLAQVAEAEVIIARRADVNRQALEAAKKLRGVVTAGVGVEKVDVAAATELGIVVANSPGNYIAVAEATMLLVNALSKQLPLWIDAARTGKNPDSSVRGFELYGKTIGLVGFGRIGRWVAGLARAFGMEVLAYDPYVKESPKTESGQPLATLVSFEELLRTSDFVSLHPVLTPETRHMMSAAQFAMMKPTALLVNTSRGGVVDERALVEALRQGQIAGAGLDVFEVEPPELDNPLLAMPNVIGTPHALPRTEESMARCAAMTQESVLLLLEGQLPNYVVNRDVRWRVLQEA
jgi:D-3-phosphoglycerate dehydrogenase / 2-oxoglutarate reductase